MLHPCFPLPYLLLELPGHGACRTQLTSRPRGRYRKGRTCTAWALLPWGCSFDYHWSYFKVPNSTGKLMTLRAAREGGNLSHWSGLALALIEVKKQFLTILMSVGLSSRGESESDIKLMLGSAQPLFKDIKGRGSEKPSWEAIRPEKSMHRYLRICTDACGTEQIPGSLGLLRSTEFINQEKGKRPVGQRIFWSYSQGNWPGQETHHVTLLSQHLHSCPFIFPWVFS